MAIPAVDFSDFLHGSLEAKAAFATRLTESLSQYGAVKLTGHSVQASVIGELFDWDKKYFDLPMNLRRKNLSREGHIGQKSSRGYKGYGEEKVWKLSPASADLPDARELKEYFDMGPPSDKHSPTPWPDEVDIPGFRTYMESQYEFLQAISMQLMQAVELGMQVPKGTFLDRCLPEGSELRLNHYPAVPLQDLDVHTTLRSWPHTDTGLFSFVFQGGGGGLQVEDRSRPGEFVVQAGGDPDEMIVLVANTLERWTNGSLRACLHKVALPKDFRKAREAVPSRRSVIFFFRANDSTSAGPLPHFVTTEQPARFPDIKVAEYNLERNKLMYG